jgi:hypothetical protein
VKRRTGRDIQVVGIDKKEESNATLKGDNLKYIAGIKDLSAFDVIDLDAYGVPYRQVSMVLGRGFGGVVFVTFIQSLFGGLPKDMLKELGYSSSMLNKCRSIFNRNGVEKFLSIVYNIGVERVSGYFLGNKSYFFLRRKN